MSLWVVRPRLWLPARMRRQQLNEENLKLWQKRVWKAIAAATAVVLLNFVGLKIALHWHSGWASLPMAIAALPLVWLWDKAAFDNHLNDPPLSEKTSDLVVVSDLSSLILKE